MLSPVVGSSKAPRPPRSPIADEHHEGARIIARGGGHRFSGYQAWWRSGRDSNSRTGYARYGISSAAPSTRLGDRSAAHRFYPPSRRPERRLFPEGRPSRLSAALITQRWLSAWGKLPSISPVPG